VETPVIGHQLQKKQQFSMQKLQLVRSKDTIGLCNITPSTGFFEANSTVGPVPKDRPYKTIFSDFT